MKFHWIWRNFMHSYKIICSRLNIAMIRNCNLIEKIFQNFEWIFVTKSTLNENKKNCLLKFPRVWFLFLNFSSQWEFDEVAEVEWFGFEKYLQRRKLNCATVIILSLKNVIVVETRDIVLWAELAKFETRNKTVAWNNWKIMHIVSYFLYCAGTLPQSDGN